jgi:hypothetical protein
MTRKKSNPILRIYTYNNGYDFDLLDIVEEALNRAKIKVKIFGGGSYINNSNNKSIENSYTDFYINSYEDFDIEFCNEIVSTIIKTKFDTEIFEDDPFLMN